MTLDLFSKQSDTYAVSRPRYPQAWYRFLAAQCADTNLVREAACGNGQASGDLAQLFKQVVATDLSQQQIDNAVEYDGVSYAVSAAEDSVLPDRSCDLVCTAQALHWFDLPLYWKTVQRVLKPQGIFATWGYNWNRFDTALDACIDAAVFEPIAPYWADNNKLLWNAYRDIDFPFESIEVPKIAMPADYNLFELFNLYRSMSGVQLYIQQHGEQFLQQAFERVQSVWGDPHQSRRCEWEFVAYCGRAT